MPKETDWNAFLEEAKGKTPRAPEADWNTFLEKAKTKDTQELSSKQRRLWQSARRRIPALETEMERVHKEDPSAIKKIGKPVVGGFFRVIDIIDRPRNAVAVTLEDFIKGERDTGILGKDLWKGLSAEERADADDLLEAINPYLKEGIVATWINSVPWLQDNPKAAELLLDLTIDTVTDPLTFLPSKVVTAPARLLISKPMRGVGRLLGLSREPLNPLLKEALAAAPDTRYFEEHKLVRRAHALERRHKGMSKGVRELAHPLKEETDLKGAWNFIQEVKSGKIDPETAKTILKDFDTFKNPDTIREIIGVNSEKQRRLLFSYVNDLNTWDDLLKKGRESRGILTHDLSEGLRRAIIETEKKQTKTIGQEIAEGIKDTTKEFESKMGSVSDQKVLLRKVIGDKKMAQVIGALRKEANAIVRAKETQPLGELLQKRLEQISPEFVSGLMEIHPQEVAAEALYRRSIMGTVTKAAESEKLAKLSAEFDLLSEAMEALPNYSRHVFSDEAMKAMRKAGKTSDWGRWLRDPRAPSDIMRHFSEFNIAGIRGRGAHRGMSHNEVERIIKAGNWGPTRGKPLTKTGLWASANRHVTGNEQIAKALNTKPEVIIATQIKETAQSVAASDLAKIGARAIGKNLDELTELERRFWKPLEDINKLPVAGEVGPYSKLVRSYHKDSEIGKLLREKYFDPQDAAELFRAWDSYVNPGKILKAYDNFNNWWKSYQLFLYPWVWTRNAFGNFHNMFLSGWNPADPRDLLDFIKASHVQNLVATGHIRQAKRIKFWVKDLDRYVDGYTMSQHGLRNGAINSGWFGSDVGWDLAREIDPHFHADVLIPGSKNWIPIKVGKAINQHIENQARFTTFVNQSRKGKNYVDSAGVAKKFLGDYRSDVMTATERALWGRLVPFYRWTRFNIPLQAESLLDRGRRTKILGIMRGIEGLTEDDLDFRDLPPHTPDWLRAAAGIPIKRDGENLDYLLLENWLPSADLGKLTSLHSAMKFGVQETTPVLRVPLELIFGRKLYSGREIDDEDTEYLAFAQKWIPQLRNPATIEWLSSLRALDEIDRWDPLRPIHPSLTTRVERSRRTRKEFLWRLAGPTVKTRFEPMDKMQYDLKRLELLQRRVGKGKRYIEKHKELRDEIERLYEEED